MSAPTLYFLKVTERWSVGKENRVYEIWEQHMCQERGCVKTQPEFIKLAFTKAEAKAAIADWKTNPPLNSIVEDVEWETIEGIDIINDVLSVDAHGVYVCLEEMVMAMAELSGLKPYKILNDEGKFAGYTFEVVE